MISRDFYKSEVCMAETGATWVLCNKNYIPVILPPYEYNNVKGVVRNTQNGILLDAGDISSKLEKLKLKVETFLNIENKICDIEWSRKKEEFIKYIKEKVENLEDLEANIKDISIVESRIVCKISIKNNTNDRQRIESVNVCIASKLGHRIREEINDWTVASVVIQPLEEVNFYIGVGKTGDIIKNSHIDKKNSTIEVEHYSEE